MNTGTKQVGTEPESAQTSKAKSAIPHKSRSAAKAENLVCRYCGSEDLAPSFKKRRDARCRACFKKRYGSATRQKNSARTRKKAAK